MTDAAILVENLTRRFGARVALDGVSLSLARGEELALLGPNGAGKTTLMSILATLLRPDGGRALVAGADVVRQSVAARRGLGVVFQDASLDDRLTAAENLDFHGRVHGMPRRSRAEATTRLLALVELEPWRDEIVRTFSGGMRRRLEIARALMHGPAILIFDEPTVGLDAQTRLHIRGYLARLRARTGLSVLTTTHYIDEAEDADRVAIIDHGRLIAEGTPAALRHSHARQRLVVRPRDAAARGALLAAHPDAVALDDHLALTVPDEGFVDAFLARHGAAMSEIRVEEPSLESVFIALTGRALRDRPDALRDAEKAEGRRRGRT